MKKLGFIRVISQRRYVFGAVIVACFLCLPLLGNLLRPTYEATAELAYVGSGSASTATTLANAILPSSDLPDLVMSTAVVERARELAHVDASAEKIRQHQLFVKASPHSNVVPVAVRSKNPGEAQALANDLVDSAVDQYHHLVQQQYDVVLSKIQDQLNVEQAYIRGVDAKLQSSVQADSAVGAADSLDVISKNLTDLQAERATAYATYIADKAAMSAQSGGQQGSDLSKAIREQILTADPAYQAMATAQAKDAATLAATKGGYTDDFPGIAGLQEKVDIEKRATDRAAATAIATHPGNSATYATLVLDQHTAAALAAGDEARVRAIDKNIAEAQASLRDLPRYGVSADLYRAQRDSAAAAYQQLQIRYQQTVADRAQAADLGAVFVLDHANAAYPRIPEFVLASLIVLFILALATGAAYAAESLDPRIRTAVDVEDLYGVPRVGSV